jgi:NAD(P)-dependent dehydrogenase (short-subunit alcohol dehydrogenase family)
MSSATDELARFRVDGRVAVVSGGTGGIGQRVALALARAGADVAVLGRTAPEATDLARQIEDAGAQALLVAADVTKRDDADRAIDDVMASSPPSAVVPAAPSIPPSRTPRTSGIGSSTSTCAATCSRRRRRCGP